MKAEEVLKQYAAGERNFRGVNLRGQSFKGQNLSGADFSEADIRSTNFTGANLRGTNFTGAKCGLQKRYLIFSQLVSSLMLILSQFFSILTLGMSYVLINAWNISNEIKSPDIIVLALLFLFYFVTVIFLINKQGVYRGFIQLGSIIFILSGLLVSLVGNIHHSQSELYEGLSIALIASFILLILAGIAFIIGALGLNIWLYSISLSKIARAGCLFFIVLFSFFIVLGSGALGNKLWTIFLIVLLSQIPFLSGLFVGLRTLRGDTKDAWLRSFAIAFAAIS